jgi:hypothetical protein
MFLFVRILFGLVVISSTAWLDVANGMRRGGAARLAFPAGIPGYQSIVTGVNPEAQSERFVHVRAGDTDIYFPIDGRQPTTEQAIRWSGAMDPDRRIAEWYLIAMGVTGLKSIGWALGSTDTRALLIQVEAQGGVGYRAITMSLRRIASTPVGRVLMYRIVIEACRVDPRGMGVPEAPDEAGEKGDLRRRNRARTITISANADVSGGTYNDVNGKIEINPTATSELPTIGWPEGEATYVTTNPRYQDCTLLHEMVHWYHHLRAPKRFGMERGVQFEWGPEVNPVIQGYWSWIDHQVWLGARGSPSWRQLEVTFWPWMVVKGTVRVEEVRCILGVRKDSTGYLEGDDISDNLYRASLDRPLRYGLINDGRTHYEDTRTIDMVIGVTEQNVRPYMPTDRNNPETPYTRRGKRRDIDFLDEVEYPVRNGCGNERYGTGVQ